MTLVTNLNGKKNIVILGAGFAGVKCAIATARELKKHSLHNRFSVILIDRGNAHLFTPALYEIACIPKEKADAIALQRTVMIPAEEIVRPHAITFLQRPVTSINRFAKTVHFEHDEELEYEYLVVALGSETDFMGIPGLDAHAHRFKTFADAIVLRNAIETLVQTKDAARILVAGAGPAGVELVAEFYNFTCMLQQRRNGRKECDMRLELLDGNPTVLPNFPSWMIRKVDTRLRAMGIKIRTETRVSEVTSTEAVAQDGTRIPYDLFIWAGGVRGSSVLKTTGLSLTKKGNIPVNAFLQAEENGKIFVIGDNASFIHPKTKMPLPWTVPVAEAEAPRAARNIVRHIRGKRLKPFRPLERYPAVVTVGRKFAVADLLVMQFSGILAWIVKQFIELRYYLSVLPRWKAIRTWLQSLLLYISND